MKRPEQGSTEAAWTRPRHEATRWRVRPVRGLTFFAAAILGMALTGCRTMPPTELPPTGLHPHRCEEPVQPLGFEPFPVFQAEDLLPAHLLAGSHFAVEGEVVNNGLTNLYVVESDFGTYYAVGAEMVALRVSETEAIARLRDMKMRTAFAKGTVSGLEDVALGPVRFVVKILKNPLYAVRAIPTEIIEVYALIEMARMLVEMEFTKETVNEIIDFDSARKDLARSLGVEPDALNGALQEELFGKARAYYAGRAPIALVAEYAPGIPFPEVVVGRGGETVGEAVSSVRDEFSPKRPKRRLRAMGVAKEDRKALERNFWYTTRERRGMIGALADMEDTENRDLFVQAALRAGSADLAHHFRRLAQLMSLYHEEVAPLEKLRVFPEGDLALGAADGRLIAFIFGDHVVWSEEVAGLLDHPREHVPDWARAAVTEVVVSGTVSEQARSELTRRGHIVTEQAFEKLTPPEPRKRWYRRWWEKLDSL